MKPLSRRRYILLYGPPRVGVTSLGGLVGHPDILPFLRFVDRIEGEPPDGLVERVHRAEMDGGTSTLIGGRPYDVTDLLALARLGIADAGNAILVRLSRAGVAIPEGWNRELAFVENMRMQLGIPGTMIPTDDLMIAAQELVRRAALER